jgi:hypothetical protein
VAAHRSRWRVWQRFMDPASFVFLDETGAATNMARRYGWGTRGERLIDAAPHGHWKTTTFVAGLKHDGIIAPFVLDGPMTGEILPKPMSHSSWRQRFSPVTWSCSTTCRLTRLLVWKPRSGLQAPASCTCPPTVLI